MTTCPRKIILTLMISAAFIAAAALSPSANAAPDDACSLLTQSQLTKTLGASVDAGSSQGPNDKKVCTWRATSSGDAANSIKYVTLMLQGSDAFQAGKSVSVKSIIVTPVSNLGDDAYYLAVGNNVGLIVKKGNVVFKVAVYASSPLDKKQALEKTLAQQVLSGL
jgi:hypothetical protein